MARFFGITLGLVGVLLVDVASAASSKEPWTEIRREAGVIVEERAWPEKSLVEFRGVTIIDAPIKDLFAVLFDDEFKTEWMDRISEFRVVEAFNKRRIRMYNRIQSPFALVSDRDVVFDSDIRFLPQHRTIVARFYAVDDKREPERDNAVRMKELSGQWVLVMLGTNETRVTYWVRADPGGLMPTWVVNIANSRIPFRTLVNLERQVKKPIYERSHMLLESLFDWSGFEWSPPGEASPARLPESLETTNIN